MWVGAYCYARCVAMAQLLLIRALTARCVMHENTDFLHSPATRLGNNAVDVLRALARQSASKYAGEHKQQQIRTQARARNCEKAEALWQVPPCKKVDSTPDPYGNRCRNVPSESKFRFDEGYDFRNFR